MSFPCSDNGALRFRCSPHLIYVQRTTPSLAFFSSPSSLCFIVPRKGALEHHTQGAATSRLPSLVALQEVERETLHLSPTILRSPFFGRRHTLPHPHPRPQSGVIQPQPPYHQYGRPRWQIDAAAGFFFFFFPFLSPTLPPPNLFSPQPWHKMVKWCSTAEFNFTVQLGPWLHCQIQINVHLTNMDQGNSGWQPAVIGAIDSCVEFYAPSTPAYHWWNWLIKWIHCYNYL